MRRKTGGLGDQTLPKHVRAEEHLVVPLNEMMEGMADLARACGVLGVEKLQHGHHKVRREGGWGKGKGRGEGGGVEQKARDTIIILGCGLGGGERGRSGCGAN